MWFKLTHQHGITIEDCVCHLTTGVCYSDVYGDYVDRVVYSAPSSHMPSPPPSPEVLAGPASPVYLIPSSRAPSPEVPTCPVSPTESSISYTHLDYEGLTDQLNQSSLSKKYLQSSLIEANSM